MMFNTIPAIPDDGKSLRRKREALMSISPRMFRAFEHAWLFNLYNAYINDAP